MALHFKQNSVNKEYRSNQSKSDRQLSPQIKIYNRNVYLRQAYKSMLQKNHQQEIKQLANSEKLDSSSYKILKDKIDLQIQKSVNETIKSTHHNNLEQITYEQMSQVIYKTNPYLKKASNALKVEQLLSQVWLYLKNYNIQNEFLDSSIFSTFLKILMDPKGFKPFQIKKLMMNVEEFRNSQQLKRDFIQKYPELEEQALQDIDIFNLWVELRQQYRLFSKSSNNECLRERKNFHQNEHKFQPEISAMSRIYAQKSLNKYLSSNKLSHQKSLHSKHLNTSNQQENQLHQYLSNKATPQPNEFDTQSNLRQGNEFSYHELLYRRKLEKEDISRQYELNSCSSESNVNSRKATPSEVQQIVDKMYFVPEKKTDFDYKTHHEEQQLKKCTFHPTTIDYPIQKTNASVQGFQKEVNRLKKGREEKVKLKQIYDNLGKPKNLTSRSRTPSFLERDVPKLILQVNIGGGRVEKIKLHGNEDAKIVAKKFINKHSLQNSMLSVLEELIDQNLRNL